MSKRTLNEFANDLGAVLTTGDQSIAGIKTFTTQVSVTGSFLSLSPLPDNRSKIRLFGTSFEWGIGTQSATTFGRLNDTAVTFNVPNTDARGWLWGDSGHTLPSQGSMSLTSNGNLTVANSLRLGYGESDTEDVVAYGFDHNGTVRIKLNGVPVSSVGFTIVDSSDVEVFNIRGGGRVKHARGFQPDESVRIDQKSLLYSSIITTIGIVNDYSPPNENPELIILGSSVTELTGVDYNNLTAKILITAQTTSKIIRNESTLSSASNRFSIGSDLTINANETYMFAYIGLRWRRIL